MKKNINKFFARIISAGNGWKLSALLPNPLEQEIASYPAVYALRIDNAEVITVNGDLTLLEEGKVFYSEDGQERADHWERETPLKDFKGIKKGKRKKSLLKRMGYTEDQIIGLGQASMIRMIQKDGKINVTVF